MGHIPSSAVPTHWALCSYIKSRILESGTTASISESNSTLKMFLLAGKKLVDRKNVWGACPFPNCACRTLLTGLWTHTGYKLSLRFADKVNCDTK